jgi:hypothetical protein
MGNIVGEPFKDYVKQQINLRQDIHGKVNRDIKDINYLNSRTSWIKLASGTKIEMERLNMLPNLSQTQKEQLIGLGLAKKFVLFNGTSKIGTGTDTKGEDQLNFSTKDQNALAKAIKDAKVTKDYGKVQDIYYNSSFTSTQKTGFLGSEGAYFSGIGEGKYDFGIVPMPGIEDVSVRALERGSIRRATIKLKVYNKQQFDIIDILYLRLGYTLLLEWGDSHYINNKNGEIEKLRTTLIEKEFFRGDPSGEFATTYYKLLDVLEKEREKYSGCYDALVGKVSNFKWTFNPDGTYGITLDIISLGDVIESLKINVAAYTQKESTTLSEEDENLINSKRKDNELSKMFYNIKTYGIKHDVGNINLAIAGTALALTPGNPALSAFGMILNYFNFSTSADNTSLENGITFETVDTKSNTYYNGIKVGRCISIPPDYKNIYDALRKKNNIGLTSEPDMGEFCEFIQLGTVDLKFQWYIRFGNLLEAINQLLIHDLKSTSGDVYSELQIDNNPITNLMYYIPNMVSFDPRVCIISNEIEKPDGFIDKIFKGINPFRLDSKSGEFSYGKIMNIYLNMNYVLELLFETDKDGNIIFMDFLRKICDGINKSLGGVNRLEPKISPDNQILKIYDQTPLPGKENLPPEIFPTSSIDSQFELYGYNNQDNTSNFIHNVGLTTEITPEFATMITVGATADGYVVGEEATAFSKWNNGIVDRFKETMAFANNSRISSSIEEKYDTIKINYLNLLKQGEDTSNISNWYSYTGFIINENFTLGSQTRSPNSALISAGRIEANEEDDNFGLISTKINSENINANINIIKEYYKYIQASAAQKETLASSGQTGFLPFNLQLDMDGISGMKLYQKIEVNSKFLPTNYPEKLEFISTNIDHELRENKWVTKLNSIATVNNLLSTQKLKTSLTNNLNSYLEQLRNEGKIDDKFTKVYKDYSTVIPPESMTLNPIIISNASQVDKYMKLYGPNSFYKRLPEGFDVKEGKYYKNFIIRKGNAKNSYATQFLKLTRDKSLYNTLTGGGINIKNSVGYNNPGELGNGADISKRLFITLSKMLVNAKKEGISLTITAGNDAFHQGKTLNSNAKYPTSNVTPANTTHTRGLAIDVSVRGMNTDEINIIIDFLYKNGFGGILYHDPPHIHANINPNLPTEDRPSSKN